MKLIAAEIARTSCSSPAAREEDIAGRRARRPPMHTLLESTTTSGRALVSMARNTGTTGAESAPPKTVLTAVSRWPLRKQASYSIPWEGPAPANCRGSSGFLSMTNTISDSTSGRRGFGITERLQVKRSPGAQSRAVADCEKKPRRQSTGHGPDSNLTSMRGWPRGLVVVLVIAMRTMRILARMDMVLRRCFGGFLSVRPAATPCTTRSSYMASVSSHSTKRFLTSLSIAWATSFEYFSSES